MSYSVVWRPEAEHRLAGIWNGAADRRAVTEAADEIDLLLRRDPFGAGESRSGLERIVIVRPLAAMFDVVVDDQRVVVLSVALVE